MRRPPSRSRVPVAGMIGFALALALATTSRGQEATSDATSLARYIPKDNVLFYLEYDGLDAHADAWKKTAAYKILNDTPAGVMLEEVFVQSLDYLRAVNPLAKSSPSAASGLALIKHVARSGFVLAGVVNKEAPKGSGAVLVIRNGFKDKNIRANLATSLQAANAPGTKPQAVVRAGHKVISGVDANGRGFAWWVEESKKEDLIYVSPSPEVADLVLETLDGKRPNSIGHPRRAELLKSENGFQPTGLAFADPILAGSLKALAPLGLAEFSKLDVRWGFQDDALMTVARIVTPSPRKGIPALLEGATLDKAKLPPIPEGVADFSVVSFDMHATLDRLAALVKAIRPDAQDPVKMLADSLKEKTKLRLKEDVLAHLGPKVAWYTVPAKKGATAPAAAPAIPGLPGLPGMPGAGMDLPRFAMVFDIDSSAAFGKVLEQAMVGINKELKPLGKPPGEAPAKGSRVAKGAAGASLEFRPVSGEAKGYVLNVPQDHPFAPFLPPTVRPTIRVGAKYAVLASSPEVARAVLEAKGTWAPPSNLAAAYQGLAANLKVLNVTDPRETLPGLLAALPGKVQQLAGVMSMVKMMQQPPGGGAPPPAPAPLVFKIDPAKLPSADSIRALLFPSLFTVESTGEEIRIVARDAFPSMGDPSTVALQMPLILPAIQAARNAAQRAAPPAGGAPPPVKPPGGAPGGEPSKPAPAKAAGPATTATGPN